MSSEGRAARSDEEARTSRRARAGSAMVGPPVEWRGGEEGLVLAIDTSTRVGGVALSRGRQLLGEDTWQAGGHQTRQILPAAIRLWERGGYTVRDLALVVVATGPGSFTGLRVGVSLAKGLCLPLGIPLVGVPTLDALAYQAAAAAPRTARVMAVVCAGRGMYYVGTYAAPGGQLRREGALAVVSAEELAAMVGGSRGEILVAGELEGIEVPASRASSDAASSRRARMLPAVAGVRRGGFLAELGRWTLAAHGAADAALLQPLYLRRAPAE